MSLAPTGIMNDGLEIGDLRVAFHRTLRIPDDGSDYPLPPGLGPFPIRRVDDYQHTVPEKWKEQGGVFLPMYQREAMWMSFDLLGGTPLAVKVAIGKVDALTGQEWTEDLEAKPQNYIVCPDQPWLDGINAGDGFIRQFVAMPLGMGYTVEGQITGKEEFGGIQLKTFGPKPGRLDEIARHEAGGVYSVASAPAESAFSAEMGLGAGGRMVQAIYPDAFGIETWDPETGRSTFVHIANSAAWRDITGEEPPPTPVSAQLYTEHGYPWFELYDEDKGDVPGSDELAGVKSIKDMDKEKGFGSQQDDSSVTIGKSQVKKVGDAGAPRSRAPSRPN